MTLLIVDDDKLTRNNIKNFLSNNLNYAAEIKTAEDGSKGLEIIASQKIDVIISDIKMALLDGLKFGEQLMSSGYRGQLIYISGYADKEILLKSIKIGAVNFLEKPIDSKELLDTVNRCILHLSEENESLIFKLVMDRERSNMYSRIARQLVGRNGDLAELRQDLSFARPTFLSAKKYWIVRLYLTSAERGKFDGMPDSPIQKLLSKYPACLVFHEGCCATAIIPGDFTLNDQQRRTQFEQWLLVAYRDQPAIGAISKSVGTLEELPELYDRLAEVLESAYFCSGTGVIDDSAPQCLCTEGFDRAILMMRSAMHSGSPYEFEQAFSMFSAAVSPKGNRWFSDCKLARIQLDSLMDELTQSVSSRRKPAEQTALLVSLQTRKRMQQESIARFLEIMSQTWQSSTDVESRRGNLFVASALSYIQEHLNGSISLNDVAEQCNLSPSYLNNLFKREMQTTVGNYILMQKLNYSEQLLLENRMNIKELAYFLGFYDANHFIKAFKRAYQITPMQYRQQRGARA